MKNIAVLTSGGDSPGMNACIRAVVRTALQNNLGVLGVERGYNGLISDKCAWMGSVSVSNIIQRGGTILKTARSKEFMTSEGRAKAYHTLQQHQVEGLVVIGGNGSYAGALALSKEYEIKVIGVPGTIDNDLFGTDYTIGYDTAVNTALQAIDKIRDTADSHDRIFFVEVMGRDSGFIALQVGLGGGAEAILIPETETTIADLVSTLKSGWGRQKSSQVVIVAEGDDQGNAYQVVEKIKAEVPEMEYRICVLGHIQRGGAPTAADRTLASRLGAAAVHGLINGVSGAAAGIVNDVMVYTNFEEAITRKKSLNPELIALAEALST